MDNELTGWKNEKHPLEGKIMWSMEKAFAPRAQAASVAELKELQNQEDVDILRFIRDHLSAAMRETTIKNNSREQMKEECKLIAAAAQFIVNKEGEGTSSASMPHGAKHSTFQFLQQSAHMLLPHGDEVARMLGGAPVGSASDAPSTPSISHGDYDEAPEAQYIDDVCTIKKKKNSCILERLEALSEQIEEVNSSLHEDIKDESDGFARKIETKWNTKTENAFVELKNIVDCGYVRGFRKEIKEQSKKLEQERLATKVDFLAEVKGIKHETKQLRRELGSRNEQKCDLFILEFIANKMKSETTKNSSPRPGEDGRPPAPNKGQKGAQKKGSTLLSAATNLLGGSTSAIEQGGASSSSQRLQEFKDVAMSGLTPEQEEAVQNLRQKRKSFGMEENTFDPEAYFKENYARLQEAAQQIDSKIDDKAHQNLVADMFDERVTFGAHVKGATVKKIRENAEAYWQEQQQLLEAIEEAPRKYIRATPNGVCGNLLSALQSSTPAYPVEVADEESEAWGENLAATAIAALTRFCCFMTLDGNKRAATAKFGKDLIVAARFLGPEGMMATEQFAAILAVFGEIFGPAACWPLPLKLLLTQEGIYKPRIAHRMWCCFRAKVIVKMPLLDEDDVHKFFLIAGTDQVQYNVTNQLSKWSDLMPLPEESIKAMASCSVWPFHGRGAEMVAQRIESFYDMFQPPPKVVVGGDGMEVDEEPFNESSDFPPWKDFPKARYFEQWEATAQVEADAEMMATDQAGAQQQPQPGAGEPVNWDGFGGVDYYQSTGFNSNYLNAPPAPGAGKGVPVINNPAAKSRLRQRRQRGACSTEHRECDHDSSDEPPAGTNAGGS
eukprot:g6340.t1